MEQNNNHPLGWTTLEEAKQLVKAGLPVETADMHYWLAEGREYVYTGKCSDSNGIPCWSLGALINLLPEILMDDIRCYPVVRKPIYTGQWQVAYVNGLYKTLHYETSIEAVMEIIIWLLKNKRI